MPSERRTSVRVVEPKNASRPGIAASALTYLIDEGLSTRQIAARLEISQATVKYWLRRHGLATRPQTERAARRGTRGEAAERVVRECRRHGPTEFWLEKRGIYRCLKCRSEAVSRRRRRVKEILVAEAGGKCAICGYDRCIGALQFHHREPAKKRFALAGGGFSRSLASARVEAEKCVLLCSNCHAEVEAAMVTPA